MKNNKNSSNKNVAVQNIANNKKYSQRTQGLSGVKVQPVPRTRKERQIAQLTYALEHFEKVKKQVTHEVCKKLGYDFNRDYTVDPNLKLDEIILKNEKHPQRFSIPMDPAIVEKFKKAPKYIIKTVDSVFKGEKHFHEKTQYLCIALLDEGPMLFEFYRHLKYPYGAYSQENFNIGFSGLLHGTDYFHIDRYDSVSLQGHTQVFDQNGDVVMNFVSRQASQNKPHSHPYDLRYAVLFKGKDSVGHEDRHDEQKYSSYETAVRAWKKILNIHELSQTFSGNVTIGEIYDELKKIESELLTQNNNKDIKSKNYDRHNNKKNGGKE